MYLSFVKWLIWKDVYWFDKTSFFSGQFHSPYMQSYWQSINICERLFIIKYLTSRNYPDGPQW